MTEFNLNLMMLAQDNAPVPTQTPANTGEMTGQPATGSVPSLPPTQTAPSGGLDSLLPMMALVMGVLLVFSLMRTRGDRKKRDTMLNAIKKHDRVQTIGGVLGSVVEVKADHVVLKVDEASNTRITFARSAIQQVLTSAPEASPAAVEKPA